MNYLLSILILVAIMILIAIPLVLRERRAKRRKLEQVFADRQVLDERAFYEKYFQERGVPFFVVSKLRNCLEHELDADLSRLTAADDFKKNLSFFWEYDSLAGVNIVFRLEEEFDIKITDSEAESVTTIDDLVSLVWSKVKRSAA